MSIDHDFPSVKFIIQTKDPTILQIEQAVNNAISFFCDIKTDFNNIYMAFDKNKETEYVELTCIDTSKKSK